MSLTFRKRGIDDIAEGVFTNVTTSYTFDILPNASATTPGDAAFIVVMGSWSPNTEGGRLLYTRFLDSSGNTRSCRYTTIAPYTNSVRRSSNKSYTLSAANNWWSSHGNLNDETSFDGERSHFMFHITNNPQLGSTSDGHPRGYLHCSGTYYYVERTGNSVMGSCDQVIRQDSTDNQVEQMRISVNSGYMSNIRVKVYHLGAR